MNQKKFIIAIAGVLVLVIAGVLFAVFSTNDAPKDTQVKKPVQSKAYVLTENDKAQVKLLSNSFLSTIGTYGWNPDVILNQTNLNVASSADSVYAIYAQLDHSSPDLAARSLNKLTDSTGYNNSMNTSAFSTPFSVTSKFTGDFIFPSSVSTKDGFPSIKLTTPVETTLVFVAQDSNYRDDSGKLIRGAVRVETLKFTGALNLTFVLKPNGWAINDFDQNIHVFATDKNFTFMDGSFATDEAKPISFVTQTVNPDGTLGAPVDNLSEFKASQAAPVAPQATPSPEASANPNGDNTNG